MSDEKQKTVEIKQERSPELIEIEKKFGLNAVKSNLTRARSLTIGTQFNGCYEIGIRSDDGTYYYTVITQNDLPAIRKMFSVLYE